MLTFIGLGLFDKQDLSQRRDFVLSEAQITSFLKDIHPGSWEQP